MKDERSLRKHARRKIEVLVSFELNGIENEYVSRELSEGGVFVVTDEPLSIGTQAELNIKIGKESIKVEGEVVYSVDKKQAASEFREPGMGIKFLRLSLEIKKKIISVIF